MKIFLFFCLFFSVALNFFFSLILISLIFTISINGDLHRRCHLQIDRHHRLMERAYYRVIVVYHRSPEFVPLYFALLSLAPKKIQNVSDFFVWCSFTWVIRIIRIIRIYFSLRAYRTIFECLSRLIFALSSIKCTQVLQRCRHCW
jgi:hypothetical protein